MRAADVTKALNSRGTLTMTIAVMVASALWALDIGEVNRITADKGLVFNSPDLWIADPGLSLTVNIAVLLAVVGLMIFVNKAYNIPRTITLIFATFFTVIVSATPDLTAQLCSGTVVAAVIVASMAIMFSTFAAPSARRRVFLIFFLLSGAVAVQYAFIVYLPVFILACAQMRIFTFRTVLAALLGIITPWWLMFGSGIIGPADIHLPRFVNVLEAAPALDTVITALTGALTALLSLTAYMLSLLKLITYNAQMRACNGLLSLVSFVTILAMCVDFTNYLAYLTLLDCCAAFFLGHLFVIRNAPRSWIAITAIIVVYYTIYIWRIFA